MTDKIKVPENAGPATPDVPPGGGSGSGSGLGLSIARWIAALFILVPVLARHYLVPEAIDALKAADLILGKELLHGVGECCGARGVLDGDDGLQLGATGVQPAPV